MRTETFVPDYILEVTNACNMSCKGCYAPNVLLDQKEKINSVKELKAEEVLQVLGNQENLIIAIRGGEPTLNSQIIEILKIAQMHNRIVYLETNGWWIEENSPLFQAIVKLNIIIKLSSDSMHRSIPENIARKITLLKNNGVRVVLAVTEFQVQAAEVHAAKIEKLVGSPVDWIWQPKVTSSDRLIRPKNAVVTVENKLSNSLSSKFNPANKVFFSWLAMIWVFSGLGLVQFPLHAQAGITKIQVGLAANFSAMSDSNTNPYANYFRSGVKLAYSTYEKKLRSRGIEIEFVEFDYGDDKIKVVETAKSAVKSKVIGVIGYLYSADALLAGPIFNENKTLLLSPSATADRVESLGRYVRRVCFSDGFQGTTLAKFASEYLKIKNVGIISVADCAYCQSLRKAFIEQLKLTNVKIAFDETVLSSDTDFADIISKIKPTDTIFVPTYEKTAALLISSLVDKGISPDQWLGGDGWGNSVALFNRIVEGRELLAYSVSHWHDSLASPLSRSFYKNFSKNFGKPPVDTAVLAYDSARIFFEALLKSKSLDRASLLESIETLDSFESLTGKMWYKNGSRTPEKPAVLLKIKNQKITFERLIAPRDKK